VILLRISSGIPVRAIYTKLKWIIIRPNISLDTYFHFGYVYVKVDKLESYYNADNDKIAAF